MAIKDTSSDYDDMVDYVNDSTESSALDDFFDIKKETKDGKNLVRKKEINPEFPEDWQTIIVNFDSLENYSEFMNKIGSKPVPKLSKLVYDRDSDNAGILSFFK